MSAPTAPKALLYVQHLLGIGHMARMQRVAESLVKTGVATTLVQGGTPTGLPPVPGVAVETLTPVRVNADDMDTLLHTDGRVLSDADRMARRDALLNLLHTIRPDLLIIEAFPFGRRQHRFELIPLLEAARAMGVRVIASSVRDVLRDKRKPGRAEETVEVIERYFDLVLVHGEEAVTPLQATFPLAHLFAHKTHYTGLVGPALTPSAAMKMHDIVISVGGGAFGMGLIETALHAATLEPMRHRAWLVLAGQNMPEADFARLATLAKTQAPNVTFLRTLAHLNAVLAGARVSVSQAGYNTVADILVSGCPAVLVPYATIKENEQRDRAIALSNARRAVHLPQEDLTPHALMGAIGQAETLPKPARLRLDGGARTAQILLRHLDETKMLREAI